MNKKIKNLYTLRVPEWAPKYVDGRKMSVLLVRTDAHHKILGMSAYLGDCPFYEAVEAYRADNCPRPDAGQLATRNYDTFKAAFYNGRYQYKEGGRGID